MRTGQVKKIVRPTSVFVKSKFARFLHRLLQNTFWSNNWETKNGSTVIWSSPGDGYYVADFLLCNYRFSCPNILFMYSSMKVSRSPVYQKRSADAHLQERAVVLTYMRERSILMYRKTWGSSRNAGSVDAHIQERNVDAQIQESLR